MEHFSGGHSALAVSIELPDYGVSCTQLIFEIKTFEKMNQFIAFEIFV